MRHSHGFTLPEVMVTLGLAGIAVLLASHILGTAIDAVDGAVVAARKVDQRQNAERWLAEALGSIEVGFLGGVPFAGSATRLECTARLRVPLGWRERQHLRVALVGDSLIAAHGSAATLLATGVERFNIDYLTEFGLQSAWVTSWESPVSAPLAVRVRLGLAAEPASVDTIVFIVGGRG